jgi:transcriptional regulator with XRE-family HTH domain
LDNQYKAICHAVATLLREERERQGMSMTTLSRISGISQQMVSYVERGMRTPTLETLLRITDALEIDLASIITQAMRNPSSLE